MPAVADPVIPGERHLEHPTNHDGIADGPGAGACRAAADDRYLGRVDERKNKLGIALTQIAQGDGSVCHFRTVQPA